MSSWKLAMFYLAMLVCQSGWYYEMGLDRWLVNAHGIDRMGLEAQA